MMQRPRRGFLRSYTQRLQGPLIKEFTSGSFKGSIRYLWGLGYTVSVGLPEVLMGLQSSDVCKRPLKEVARNRPHSRLQRDL